MGLLSVVYKANLCLCKVNPTGVSGKFALRLHSRQDLPYTQVDLPFIQV